MEITSEKKIAIKKLLKITDATQSSETAMNMFIDQMIEMMKDVEDIGDPEIFDIMEKEAKALIHEEIVVKESLHALMYPLYHKYLTLIEINGLIQFYKTPLGRKLISTNPKLMEEKMEVGQTWVQELNLKFQKKMSKILEKKQEKMSDIFGKKKENKKC